MRQKLTKKRQLLLIFCFLFLILYTMRVIEVNSTYSPQIHRVNQSDSIEIQGVKIKVLEMEREKISMEDKWAALEDESEEGWCMILTVQYENVSQEQKSCIIVETVLQSQGWKNGINMAILREKNSELMDYSLEPGEKKIVKIPFAMYSYQFQKKDWKQIADRQFEWVITGVPVKNTILLDE